MILVNFKKKLGSLLNQIHYELRLEWSMIKSLKILFLNIQTDFNMI